MVKFKIAFTIDAKTLFAYLSQALPALENLHVEEIIEKSHIVEEKLLSSAPVKVVNKPINQSIKKERKPYKPFKHPSGKRIVDFIIEFLHMTAGNATWREINNYIRALGFGKSSINSGLQRLMENKTIMKENNGVYKLLQK